MKQTHEFGAVYTAHSEILILGTFPSVLSRRAGFYYAHPQNRFWKMLGAVYGESAGDSKEEKIAFLRRHKTALWDVIKECEIENSADASIKNVVPNDIAKLISETRVKAVFTNGKKAHELYSKYVAGQINVPETPLPSTSPANARFSLEKLTEIWGAELKKY